MNLLNSETEKGKIWNGKSVPLVIPGHLHLTVNDQDGVEVESC